MPNEIRIILRKKIAQLGSERSRIDRELGAIRGALAVLNGDGRGRQGSDAAPRRRRPMSDAARRAVGKRMKAYWAKRRAEKAKRAKIAR
jgi:hypothetical protein